MNCTACEKLISDSLDAKLPESGAWELELHLAGCPCCRAYRERLERIQAAASIADAPPVPAGYWDDFSARLDLRLGSAAGGAGRPRFRVRRWRWAWLAAPAAVAGLLIVLQSFRPVPPYDTEFSGFIGHQEAAGQAAWEEAGVADDFDEAVLAAIREETGLLSPYELPALADDPGFWDGLTEDEAALIDREIAKELKS